MSGVKVALAAGLGVTAIAAGLTLTRAPATVAHSNSVPEEGVVASSAGGAHACQAGETLPRGTSAIRLALQAVVGPRVTVQALEDGRVVSQGTRGAGWTAGAVTVPVERPPRTVGEATVCFGLGRTRGPVSAYGVRTPAALALRRAVGSPFAGRMKIEYLRPGTSSWWSQVPAVARRMGLGHAAAGTWLALLAAVMALTVVALASWLVTRELA